jgi:hypothetical protein
MKHPTQFFNHMGIDNDLAGARQEQKRDGLDDQRAAQQRQHP